MANASANILRCFGTQYWIKYSKASTRGNWSEVWGSFDKRKKTVANDGAAEAGDEADMFAAAGGAAVNA